MPTCSICSLTKEASDFDRDKRRSTGVRAECKDCDAVLHERRQAQTVTEAIVAAVEQPRLAGPIATRLDGAIELRMQYYQCSGLDALHDLAMMKMSENSGLMQVKYLAALRLAGPAAGGSNEVGKGSVIDKTLDDLNKLFHQKAPKLREIRERVATFDDGSTERTIEAG